MLSTSYEDINDPQTDVVVDSRGDQTQLLIKDISDEKKESDNKQINGPEKPQKIVVLERQQSNEIQKSIINDNNRINSNNNIEIHNTTNQNSDLILIYNDNDERFTFYDNTNTMLGSFNFRQIVRYIVKQISADFIRDIDVGFSEELIELMIGEISLDPITGHSHVKLLSHMESPFMGNISMLIKLNNLFFKYENNINNDLATITNETIKKKICNFVDEFAYLIANHTLRVIAIASEELKYMSNDVDMKMKLLHNSSFITHRISQYILKNNNDINLQNNRLANNIAKIKKMRKHVVGKIHLLEKKINSQNDVIFSILNVKTPHTQPPQSGSGLTNTSFDEKIKKLFDDDITNTNSFSLVHEDVIGDSDYNLSDIEDISALNDSDSDASGIF